MACYDRPARTQRGSARFGIPRFVLVLSREAVVLVLVSVTMLAPITAKFDGASESRVHYDARSNHGDLC
jgi:hypothetical protein